MVNKCVALLMLRSDLTLQGSQFSERHLSLFMIGLRAVPMKVILHKINPFTRYRVGDDHHRSFHNGFSHGRGINDRLDIVAVDFQYVPAKTFPLSTQVL